MEIAFTRGMIFDRLQQWVSPSMAIDLGSANTLVFVRGSGIVLQEPSVLAIRQNGNNNGKGKVIAIGQKAKEMLEKTPHSVEAVQPIRDGIINDFANAGMMLRHFIATAHHHGLLRPRIIIGIPFGITKVEQRAVRESALSAGAREVYLIADPMASAIGAGLPVTEPVGSMIVDIGGGTTEIAVISLADIIVSKSIPIAGDKLDDAIVHHIKQKHNLAIGHATAEQIKIEIGTCYPSNPPKSMTIRGLDMISRLPKSIEITAKEVSNAMADPIHSIVDTIKSVLEQTPPELSADIIDSGITLAGGGSLVDGLDTLIHNETGLQVNRVDNPLSAAVLGLGKMLDGIDLLSAQAA